MKTTLKKLIVSVTCIIFALSIVTPVTAADSPVPSSCASYDITTGGTQIFHLTDDDGTEIIVTITELEQTGRIANGAYRVDFSNAIFWEAGFTVSISNNRITSAYGKYVTPYIGSATSGTLTSNNNKHIM